MRQADTTLERFPGPVTLHISRNKKLLSLGLCLGFTVFFAWFMFGFVNPKPQYRAYAAILLPIPSVFFPAWTVRAAILLLVRGTASLTLDSDGFAINQVLRSIRPSWRDVSNIRVETRYGRHKLRLIMFEVVVASAWRRGATTVTRALPDNYGLPMDDLA